MVSKRLKFTAFKDYVFNNNADIIFPANLKAYVNREIARHF